MTGLDDMPLTVELQQASIKTHWLDGSKPFLNEPKNRRLGLENMRQAGFTVTSSNAESYYTSEFVP